MTTDRLVRGMIQGCAAGMAFFSWTLVEEEPGAALVGLVGVALFLVMWAVLFWIDEIREVRET